MGEHLKRLALGLPLVILLGACSNETVAVYEPAPTTNSYEIREVVPAAPPEEVQAPPVVFCGQADPDDAVTISDEEALSYLALVNRCQRVSAAFVPDDLSPIEVESQRILVGTHHMMRETAARAAEDLFTAAADNGLRLIASSGYRSFEWQTFFHTDMVNRLGLEEARRISAVPGHSEHQLGLALDLSTIELDGGLSNAFIATPEGLWVQGNAHRFGFIISYPEGREADTGFIYEPWHIRFVGIEAATEIFESGELLEEYLWNMRE